MSPQALEELNMNSYISRRYQVSVDVPTQTRNFPEQLALDQPLFLIELITLNFSQPAATKPMLVDDNSEA